MEPMHQAMDVDHPNETAIVGACKDHLLEVDQQYNCCGIAVNLYQFSYDPAKNWHEGHIFNANSVDDLSFDDVVEASNAKNKMDANFLVHEADQEFAVENMMRRDLRMKHVGILRPFVAGFNSQVSKVITAIRVTDHLTLSVWLTAEWEKSTSTSIPPAVQDLIRTAYQAIMEIWQHGYTSVSLADVSSYHMIDDRVKIDPFRIRGRGADENNEMLPRGDFGTMITKNIYSLWQDCELVDFVHLLNNPRARVRDVLGAPVLLLPARRELMFRDFEKAELRPYQETWLRRNANPEAGWKEKAKKEDPTLEAIIDRQAASDVKKIGFATDFEGALHFSTVVAAHYPQNFRQTAEGQSGDIKDRVDSLLKQLLPGLISKRYNSEFEYRENEKAQNQDKAGEKNEDKGW